MTLVTRSPRDIREYNKHETRTIAAAAVFDTEADKIYYMPAPARHYQIVHAMSEMGIAQVAHHEQGFLTSDGFFLRRKPAFMVAEKAGQLKTKTGPADTLFSEDVW